MNKAKAEQHEELCGNLHQTYLDKNSDYGSAFEKIWAEVGFICGYTKIADKFYRIQSLMRGGKENRKVKQETLKDSLLDLANYCLLSIVEMDSAEEVSKKRHCPHNVTEGEECKECGGKAISWE